MKIQFDVRIQRRNGFTLQADETCTTDALGIVGPSGSGKSTLMDALSGAEPGARVLLDGRDISALPLEKRELAYVTQETLLFPHLSVKKNLLYGPRAEGLGDVALALGIGHILDRMPRTLSGGEKRRVTLARAILSRPRMLLLDEPFAGLDETLRREAMSLLDSLKTMFRLPMILVSHRADEVIGLTDWTIRLECGQVVSRGPSESVLYAGETQIDNYFVGVVTAPGRVRVGSATMAVVMPGDASGEVRLAIYAHDILLALSQPAEISARNVFKTDVVSAVPAGGLTLLTLAEPRLKVLVTHDARESLSLKPGSSVFAIVKASSISYLGGA